MYEILPWIGAALLVAATASVVVRGQGGGPGSWRWFAAASVGFAVFSGYAVAREGLGFWTEHTRNAWGNQIWFDLLLAVGTSWFVVAPRARTQGMRLWGWLVLVVATGCIGLTAMVARLLWLEERSGVTQAVLEREPAME